MRGELTKKRESTFSSLGFGSGAWEEGGPVIFGLATGEEGVRFGTQEGMGAGGGRSRVSEKLGTELFPWKVS